MSAAPALTEATLGRMSSPKLKLELASAQSCHRATRQFDAGSWIRAFRYETGMTQGDFAQMLGVGQPLVSKWEAGRQTFSLDAAKALHDTFQLSPELDPKTSLEAAPLDELQDLYRDVAEDLVTDSVWLLDWKASLICRALESRRDLTPESRRLLRSLYFTRTEWSYLEGEFAIASTHAKKSLRHAKAVGFDTYAGGVVWLLASSQLRHGQAATDRMTFVERLTSFADANFSSTTSPHRPLIHATLAAMRHDTSTHDDCLEAARHCLPNDVDDSLYWWGERQWNEAIDCYKAMFSVYMNRPNDAANVVERRFIDSKPSSEGWVFFQQVALHCFQASLVRLGSRERVEYDNHDLPPSVVRSIQNLTTRISGYRFRR